jgi:Ca2+/Na+ antiporter
LNLFLFLVIWAIIWYIPIPPRKFKPTSVWRFISLMLGLVLFFAFSASQTPLSNFVYGLFFTRLFVAIIEWFVSIQPIKPDEQQIYSGLGKRTPVRLSFRQQKKLFAVLFISIFLISATAMVVFSQTQRLANATYFNSFIQLGSGLPFNSTIPDDMVRLVTEELAISIARRHMSEFGSNTQVLNCHVTKSPEGKLVWVAAIGSTNIIAENYVKGFVIIDATDPAATPIIVRSEFDIGEGLWWDRNIPFRNYMMDMERTYGVSYVTWGLTTNNTLYVVTRFNIGFDLVKRYETPVAYDSQGSVQYEPKKASDIPEWMTQVYDEDWLENMINEMGGFRRGSGFDYWSGGFLWIIPPSRDRFQMTEDTRYIVAPETSDVVALVCVNPVGNQRTLSGVFKATREGVLFYDFTLSNYISGMTAEDLVEGRLPKPATGSYYAMMPLLYEVGISSGNNRLAWYVPIYWYEESGQEDETVYLSGFAIVDASDTNKIALTINAEGITSEQLVRKTRLDFIKLFGVTTYLELNASVLGKYEYVEEGTTHVVLHLDNATYSWVEATPKDVGTLQWNELMATESTQSVTARIEKRGDRWMMTYFDNINLP